MYTVHAQSRLALLLGRGDPGVHSGRDLCSQCDRDVPGPAPHARGRACSGLLHARLTRGRHGARRPEPLAPFARRQRARRRCPCRLQLSIRSVDARHDRDRRRSCRHLRRVPGFGGFTAVEAHAVRARRTTHSSVAASPTVAFLTFERARVRPDCLPGPGGLICLRQDRVQRDCAPQGGSEDPAFTWSIGGSSSPVTTDLAAGSG